MRKPRNLCKVLALVFVFAMVTTLNVGPLMSISAAEIKRDQTKTIIKSSSMSDATSISIGSQYSGKLSGEEDEYYKFTIPSSGEVSIISKAQIEYIHYYIYDANGNQVWDEDFYEDGTTGISSANEKVDLTKGTYYLVLQSHVSGNYQFHLAFQDAGETFTETGDGTNNSMSTANDISFGNTYKGQIAKNDEKDFYKFELNSSKKLTFQMTSSQIEKIYYYIYDQNGKQVWYDYNYAADASGINTVKEELNLAAGTYYLAFERWTDALTGVYTFSLNQYTSVAAANVSVGTKSYVYDGKAKKPTVTVSYKSNTLKNGTDYTVTYSNNKNVGTGKIKITGKGKYDGTKTVTFTIVPKETKIVKIQGKKRKIAIKWNAQKTQISGYEIQASKSKSFSSKTVIKVGKNSTSANITGLSKNKKYYVRIRTYKNGSQTRYVSKWSPVKSAKAK